MRSVEVEKHLQHFLQFPVVKGFRHIIEAEIEEDFLTRDDFQRGIEALTKFGYTYDLLIRPRHYRSTLDCVKANTQQKFMLDHMAKPPIKSGEFEEWTDFIQDLALSPNVYCKISGLVTEADWENWKTADFEKYIAHVINCFGKDRICFGSDWPVSLLAATYEECMQIVAVHLTDFSEEELKGFWGENTVRFYGIK